MTDGPHAYEPDSLEALIAARFGDSGPADAAAETDTVRDMLKRGSCRDFAAEPVPDGLLDTLLAAAFSAPSKSDLQQASVVIVKDPDQRRRILDAIPGNSWAETAPVVLIWLADGHRFRRVVDRKGTPFPNDHLDAFFNAVVDGAIVMSAFITAAESTGMGCCPISALRDRSDEVARILDLPDRIVPIAALAAGWPATDRRVRPRLPMTMTVHTDRYDETDFETRIDAYDRRVADFEQRPPERQTDPDRFGRVAVYGWSDHRTRQYADPHRADFGAFVRSRGFSLN